MTKSVVHIIIVNYLGWDDCIDCVESVLKSEFYNYVIYIVDNNSPNDAVIKLNEWGKGKDFRMVDKNQFGIQGIEKPARINLIVNDVNSGFAAANNIVLKKINNEPGYVWLLNPDMVVEPATLRELVNYCEKEDRNCITGAVVKNYQTKKTMFYGGGNIKPEHAQVISAKDPNSVNNLDYISGACLFTSARNFDTYGLLPEEYFLYWEESDWCWNAREKGAQLRVCENAICYDKISTVIGKGYLAQYYYSRNGLFFVGKYLPKKLESALRSMKGRMLKKIFLFQWDKLKAIRKAVKDFKNKKLHAHQ